MEIRLAELAQRVGGELHGDPDLPIRGVAGIKEAREGEITFYGNPRYEEWLGKTQASAVIIPPTCEFNGRSCIRVENPYQAFQQVMTLFHQSQPLIPAGVHPSALLGADVQIGEGAAIGPNVVIGDRTRVGSRTVILPGTVVGHDVVIGADALIYPNTVIREETEIGERVLIHAGAVIGDDGFGFVTREGRHEKVPQLGRVIIEDDVEIGANTCIDRATAGSTVIRQGTRIDNLVQVAHNVAIGRNSILCAQVGIAGSTTVGDDVTLAGQVGIVGHIQIGDRSKVGAQGGVTKSVPPDTEVSGYPAAPHHLAKRIYASMRQLPELLKTVRQLERRIAELEAQREERS